MLSARGSTRLKDDALFAKCNWGDEWQRNSSAFGRLNLLVEICERMDVCTMQAGNREPGWYKISRSCAIRAIRLMDGSAVHSIAGTLASLVHFAKEKTKEQVERVRRMISSTYPPSLSL